YTLSRKIVSVTDLWREYCNGLSGCPSVKSLEDTYGASWRKSENEGMFFRKRRELYVAIETKARTDGVEPKIAAKRLEDIRKRHKYSLDALREEIKKRKTTDF
ncbi:hypothetical protein K501DRAFT_190231, partial [Backusella circina FSU 941]